MAGVTGAWLLVAGGFLFVKGLDISLVACAKDTCAELDRLAPGIASFVVGVGMLFAWGSVVAASLERGWMARLGLALLGGAVVATLVARPVLSVADRLGVPLWLCAVVTSAVAIRPPRAVYREAIVARGIASLPVAAGIVAAEVNLVGDPYIVVFAVAVAVIPPLFSVVDSVVLRRLSGRGGSAAAGHPAHLRATGEIDDAEDKEHDQQDPDDAVHEKPPEQIE